MSQFFVVDANPNDTHGGGGCLCSPTRTSDTKGPFVVVPTNEMESLVSPHVVVCAGCACRLADLVKHGEAHAGDAGGTVTEAAPARTRGDDNRQFSKPKSAPPRPRKR